MDISLSHQESEISDLNLEENMHYKPLGFLNSEFKSVASKNFKNLNSNSIFGKKQIIKNRLDQVNSGFEFALRAVVFIIIFSFIF